ncbi:uncharacterized protein LOC143238864 isoform X2 [Tachypleus tridentatus]|uniref:uncharacterized protein LOC143238864 isoform X2 n=1 Tax=Tachypleus tridentatus TaxID=6853 RepID=UPI003FD4E3E5
MDRMEIAETPLDVLSKAVALVETEGEPESRVLDDSQIPPSSKELPTKSHKLKRTKERRHTLGGKPRNKKSSSPHLNIGASESQAEGTLSFTKDLPGYITPPLNMSHSSFSFSGMLPSYTSGNEVLSGMERKRHSTPYIFTDSVSDYNQPLDMTKKCCKNMEQQSQQRRPSVITCAPALMRSHCQRKDHSPGAPLSPLLSETSPTGSSLSHSDDNVQPGYRREVVSGMCDPVIDEHFRRSLGKDYPEFLSSATPTTPSVSITVDDHFAKALGDIWLRLQQTKPGPKDITTATAAASGTKMSPRSSPSSPILQHPQGIVST